MQPGVSDAILVHFVGIGVNSPEDLLRASITPAIIDSACRKQFPFGQVLKAAALASLPRLTVSVRQVGARKIDGAALLKLTVTDVTHKIAAFNDAPQVVSTSSLGAASALRPVTSKSGKAVPSSAKLQQLDIREYMRGAVLPESSKAGAGLNPSETGGCDGIASAAAAVRAAQSARTAPSGKGGRGVGRRGGSGDTVRHAYHLCVTTGDDELGLVFDAGNVTEPTQFDIAVIRPGRGPRIHIHLIHASMHGLDVRLLVEPKYGVNAVPKVSTKSSLVVHPVVDTSAMSDLGSDTDCKVENAKSVSFAKGPSTDSALTRSDACSLDEISTSWHPLSSANLIVDAVDVDEPVEVSRSSQLLSCDDAIAGLFAALGDNEDASVPSVALETQVSSIPEIVKHPVFDAGIRVKEAVVEPVVASASEQCSSSGAPMPSEVMHPSVRPCETANESSRSLIAPPPRRRNPGLTRRPAIPVATAECSSAISVTPSSVVELPDETLNLQAACTTPPCTKVLSSPWIGPKTSEVWEQLTRDPSVAIGDLCRMADQAIFALMNDAGSEFPEPCQPGGDSSTSKNANLGSSIVHSNDTEMNRCERLQWIRCELIVVLLISVSFLRVLKMMRRHLR